MPREPEQFLGRGDEAVFWVLTMKNVAGAIGGGLLGSRLGLVVGGPSLMPLIVAGVILGLWATWSSRGLIRLRRWLVRIRFALRRVQGPIIISADALYTVQEAREQPLIIRQGGKTLIAPVRTEEGSSP